MTLTVMGRRMAKAIALRVLLKSHQALLVLLAAPEKFGAKMKVTITTLIAAWRRWWQTSEQTRTWITRDSHLLAPKAGSKTRVGG
jgi:hypothetical protein